MRVGMSDSIPFSISEPHADAIGDAQPDADWMQAFLTAQHGGVRITSTPGYAATYSVTDAVCQVVAQMGTHLMEGMHMEHVRAASIQFASEIEKNVRVLDSSNITPQPQTDTAAHHAPLLAAVFPTERCAPISSSTSGACVSDDTSHQSAACVAVFAGTSPLRISGHHESIQMDSLVEPGTIETRLLMNSTGVPNGELENGVRMVPLHGGTPRITEQALVRYSLSADVRILQGDGRDDGIRAHQPTSSTTSRSSTHPVAKYNLHVSRERDGLTIWIRDAALSSDGQQQKAAQKILDDLMQQGALPCAVYINGRRILASVEPTGRHEEPVWKVAGKTSYAHGADYAADYTGAMEQEHQPERKERWPSIR